MADGASLGAPACNADQNVYLKTVFACVDENVLRSDYWTTTSTSTSTTSSTSTSTEKAIDHQVYDLLIQT